MSTSSLRVLAPFLLAAGCVPNLDSTPGFAPHAPYVYLGSSDRNLYAFDTATGQPRWKHPIGAELHATPLVDGNLVIVAAGDGALYGLSSSDGHQVWRTPLVDPTIASAAGPRLFTAPVALAGTVLVAARPGGTIYAVDPFTGAETASYSLGRDATQWLTPAADLETVDVAVEGGPLYALHDLAPMWNHDVGPVDGAVVPGIDGVLFSFGGRFVEIVDPATGTPDPSVDLGARVTSVGTYPDKMVGTYWAATVDGDLDEIDPIGRAVISRPDPFGATRTFVAADASLGVFASSANGAVAGVDWSWNKTLDSDFIGPPVVARVDQVGTLRVVVVSAAGHVYGLDDHGNVIWQQVGTIGGSVDALPAADVP